MPVKLFYNLSLGFWLANDADTKKKISDEISQNTKKKQVLYLS